jgi:Holliday junction resolvasome RuvABC endonuclease subunit
VKVLGIDPGMAACGFGVVVHERDGRLRALEYDRDVTRWFTRVQLDRLYERNPLWASVEECIYGKVAAVA